LNFKKYSENEHIPSNTFKSILTKINIGMPTSEINRLAKYYENLEGKINYVKFVEKLVESASQAHSLTLHSIADKLHKFIE
jgi:Ca2+-binding EF-hand superfamily protein